MLGFYLREGGGLSIELVCSIGMIDEPFKLKISGVGLESSGGTNCNLVNLELPYKLTVPFGWMFTHDV